MPTLSRKRSKPQSKVIEFPVDHDAATFRRTLALPEMGFRKVEGGWQIRRPDGSVFAYLLRVREEEADA